MENSEHYRRLANMMVRAPILEKLCCEVEVTEGNAEFSMSVSESHFHGAGGVHGTMYFLMLDNAGMLAANSIVKDSVVVTKEFTTKFLRPAHKGSLRAEGRICDVRLPQIDVEVVAYDENQREIALGSGTFQVAGVPLEECIGYM